MYDPACLWTVFGFLSTCCDPDLCLDLAFCFLFWYLAAQLWTDLGLYLDSASCSCTLLSCCWWPLSCELASLLFAYHVSPCPSLWSLCGGPQSSVSWNQQLSLPLKSAIVSLCVLTFPFTIPGYVKSLYKGLDKRVQLEWIRQRPLHLAYGERDTYPD